MAASEIFLPILALLVSVVFADHVPVLIWSPHRSMNDLPQAPYVGNVSQAAFKTKFLTRLLGKETPTIVAFLQDKLHVSDISKYADVYNPDSKGGAFKNIKDHLARDSAVELPQVMDPHLVLESLLQDFSGSVHDLYATFDLSHLDLSGSGNHLVIIRLAPVAFALNEKTAIASNDELLEKVVQHLEKNNVKYTALYTAETSQLGKNYESRRTRYLMEGPEPDGRGVFYNVSYASGRLYAYLRSVSVCLQPGHWKQSFCPFNFTVQNLNTSDMVVQTGSNRAVRIPFKYEFDRWEIMESQMTLFNVSSGVPLLNKEQMVMQDYDPVIPLLYSFHCSSMEWYSKNMSAIMLGYIILEGFQVQPFSVVESGFLLSQDCIGWFSAAIWMALFPAGIYLLILFFGIYMLASLTINSHFDDPNRKALTISSEG